MREQSLIKALARALQIVEMTDLDEAVRITAELEGDVAPLVGGPIVLVCDEIIEIAPRIPTVLRDRVGAHRVGHREESEVNCPRCAAALPLLFDGDFRLYGGCVKRTPEEQQFLKDMARLQGRPLTLQEENLAIAQARYIGDLPPGGQ